MPLLINRFNWGSAAFEQNPSLIRQLDDIYTTLANAINSSVGKFVTDSDPPNNVTSDQRNTNLSIADIWVNTSTDDAWIMTSRTSNTIVNWQKIT